MEVIGVLQHYSHYTKNKLQKSIAITESIDTRDVGEIPIGTYYKIDLVTMCVDILASTIRSARESIENSITMLNLFFPTVARVLRDADAIIDKYPGDGVMAHFALNNDGVERALKSSCIIKRLVDEFVNQELRNLSLPPIQCGVSIDAPGSTTALACVGINEHPEIIAVGNSVNIAAKMEKIARNRVVIGYDVYRRLSASLKQYCYAVETGIIYAESEKPYPGFSVDWEAVTE
jgi:class 3 adenylate cyclase